MSSRKAVQSRIQRRSERAVALNHQTSLGLFYHFGNHGEIGLSFRRPDGGCVSR